MPTALVTGASYGIGRAYALELAKRGYDIVLVARSADKLEAVAEEIRATHGKTATPIALDLTEPDAPTQLFSRLQADGIAIDFLMNNAGFGDYGAFATSDRGKIVAMVQLNVLALTDLTYQFLQPMIERKSGTIVNIGSIASFQPLPYMAVYAATKAFVLNFTEALWAENADTGVRFLACCPGATETEFFKTAGFLENGFSSAQPPLSSPESVVQATFEALDRSNDATVVAGTAIDKAMSFLPRFLPRELLAKGAASQFRPKSNDNKS
ncbi:MAG: SDR family NAD(P)-dependent oxidoreductase [Geitlerinemataceae cyanobacterium]